MEITDRFLEELLETIAELAYNDYEHGTPLDSDCIDEFVRILKDKGFSNFTAADINELFEYYKEEFTICKDRYVMDYFNF